MAGKTYGYARVSSKDQNVDRQKLAMQAFGVDAIFVEKQSGKDFERPVYKKLLRKVMQLRPKRRRQMKSWMTHQAILWIQDSEDRLRSLRSLQIHISLSPAPQARSSSKSIPSESSHWARSRC